MAMKYVMYNPLANNKRGYENSLKVKDIDPDAEYRFVDLTKISNYPEFFEQIPEEDTVILTGGDGTLNEVVVRVILFAVEAAMLRRYRPVASTQRPSGSRDTSIIRFGE